MVLVHFLLEKRDQSLQTSIFLAGLTLTGEGIVSLTEGLAGISTLGLSWRLTKVGFSSSRT